MRKTPRIRWEGLVAGAAALMLALTGCGSSGGSASASGASGSGLTDITIGAVFTAAAVPFWVAQEEGIFEKNGLKATIKQSPNFAASAPSLLNGQMQFANAATGPVITSVSKGMPLKIDAAVQAEEKDPTKSGNQLIVRKDSGITRPRDLQGKTVATNAVGSGPYIGVMANYMVDGGKPDGINWVTLDLSQQIAALKSGQVDAILGSEPYTAAALQAGLVAVFNVYSAPGVDAIPSGFNDAVVVASDDYLAKNPKIADAMYKSMVEAGEWAHAHPDAVKKMLVKYLGLSQKEADSTVLPNFTGTIVPSGVVAMGTAMTNLKMIDKSLTANDLIWTPSS